MIFSKRKPAYSQAEIHAAIQDLKELREMRQVAISFNNLEEAGRLDVTIELADKVVQRMLEKISE